MICTLCSKPVIPEQGVNGATGNHWDCTQRLFAKVDADVARIQVSRRRPRCRDGQGKAGRRVVSLVASELLRFGYSELQEICVWNQQGAHRGWKSDLAAWGVDFMASTTYQGDKIRVQVSVSSWGTMTQLAKEGLQLQASTNLAHDFDAF